MSNLGPSTLGGHSMHGKIEVEYFGHPCIYKKLGFVEKYPLYCLKPFKALSIGG